MPRKKEECIPLLYTLKTSDVFSAGIKMEHSPVVGYVKHCGKHMLRFKFCKFLKQCQFVKNDDKAIHVQVFTVS